MATPSSRVLTLSEATRFCPVQIDSIRPRMRLAVSGVFAQIGSRTFITIATSIKLTGVLPNTGETYRVSELDHCMRCLA
jgi:hypothetical protein